MSVHKQHRKHPLPGSKRKTRKLLPDGLRLVPKGVLIGDEDT